MVKRLILVVGTLLALALTACGTIATPEWAQPDAPAVTATAVPPTAIPPTPTLAPATAIDPLNAQVGRWLWSSFHTSLAAYPPVQLWMDVKDGGVTGQLSIYPNTPDIPPDALPLIQQNGCNVDLRSLNDASISGMFVSPTEARIQVSVTTCRVKFFGDVILAEPLSGEFVVEYNDALTQALLNPVDVQLTPLERGRGIFALYCSACHGSEAEGAPGIPSLDTDQVRQYTDEQILEKINNGVINTVMPAWGNVLKPEDIAGVLELIRNLEVLTAD